MFFSTAHAVFLSRLAINLASVWGQSGSVNESTSSQGVEEVDDPVEKNDLVHGIKIDPKHTHAPTALSGDPLRSPPLPCAHQ